MAQRRFAAGSLALTPQRMLALTIGPSPIGPSDTDDDLADLWWQHRDRILASQAPGTRPWAFWAFENGVPEHLRGGRPALTPVDEPTDDDELDARRAAWLAQHEPAA